MMGSRTVVSDISDLVRLMTWLSPSFPVGAFSYSHGLERAILDGLVHDRKTLVDWLTDLLSHGSAWNDAVLFAESWREAARSGCDGAGEVAQALAGSRERHTETVLQGAAFLQAMSAWSREPIETPASDTPYPVAVGATTAIHGIPLRAALVGYLHAFVSNLVQAAVRLVPLGQSDGLATIAALESLMLETAARAALSTLDDLGSATFMSEMMAMMHETQYSRVFRS
jgi:urease accessory protein